MTTPGSVQVAATVISLVYSWPRGSPTLTSSPFSAPHMAHTLPTRTGSVQVASDTMVSGTQVCTPVAGMVSMTSWPQTEQL